MEGAKSGDSVSLERRLSIEPQKEEVEGDLEVPGDGNRAVKQITKEKIEIEETDTEPKSGRGCSPMTKRALVITAIVVVIIASIIGTVGLLTYINQLQLGLAGIGTMSQATGLYTMLGGYGVTLITGLLTAVALCINARKHKKEEGAAGFLKEMVDLKVEKNKALNEPKKSWKERITNVFTPKNKDVKGETY